MQRLRSLRQTTRYTQLSNDAIDRLPSLESIGLLATILRHDDAFEFDMATLIRSKPKLGKTHAYNARRDLVKHGYIVQVKFKHTYRGRFVTDIYRAAEPHTAEDLDELRRRYTPGAQQVITDDDGHQRVETVIWAEVTGGTGSEQLGDNAKPVENSAKPQVAPDSALPESGQPESGQPESRQPDVGEAEPYKEHQSEKQKEHPHPQAPPEMDGPEGYDEPVGGVDGSIDDGGGGIGGWVAAMADSTRIDTEDTDERDPAVALLRDLRAQDGTTLSRHAIREYSSLVTRLLGQHTASSITEHVTSGIRSGGGLRHRLEQLRNGATSISMAAAGPPVGSSVPPPCGTCVNRFLEEAKPDGGVRMIRCPNCHPRRLATA